MRLRQVFGSVNLHQAKSLTKVEGELFIVIVPSLGLLKDVVFLSLLLTAIATNFTDLPVY